MKTLELALIWTGCCGVALSPVVSYGQAPPACADTMTVSTCFSFKLGESNGTAEEQKELSEKPTGSALPGSNSPTAIADYLPRLSAALLNSGVTDDLPSLNFASNVRLNDGVAYVLGITFQAGLTLHSPETASAILDSVPEQRRAAVRERFSENFDELSDPEITLSVNAENRRFGRAYGQHSQELSKLLNDVERGLPDFHTTVTALQLLLLGGASHILPEQLGEGCKKVGRTEQNTLGCYDRQFRQTLEQQITAAATAYLANNAAFTTWVQRSGFSQVADLINNKPQLNATISIRPREEVVGPEEATLRIRGEWSPVSLNGARRYCRRVTGSPGGTLDPDCFRRYALHPQTQGSLRRAERVWATVALRHARPYTAPFTADDTAAYALDAFWAVETTVGGGWYINPGAEGPQRSRIDFEARSRWERSGEVRLRPRVLGSATYTLRLGDSIAGLVGLTWASSPGLLDSDIERIRANVGVRYKLAQSP